LFRVDGEERIAEAGLVVFAEAGLVVFAEAGLVVFADVELRADEFSPDFIGIPVTFTLL
jgi:hypothetical protein